MFYGHFCTHGRLNGASQRRNILQICQRRNSITGGSGLWSNPLPLDQRCAPSRKKIEKSQYNIIVFSKRDHVDNFIISDNVIILESNVKIVRLHLDDKLNFN